MKFDESRYDVIDGVDNGKPGLAVAFGGRKFPLCFHRWRKAAEGAWGYGECKKCGRRRAWRSATLMGPVDLHWVLTGEHREMMPPPRCKLVPIDEVPDDAAGWAGTD